MSVRKPTPRTEEATPAARVDSPLLTRDEAAGYCRVGLRTFDRRVAPHVQTVAIGTRRFFDRKDIDSWLASQKASPCTATSEPAIGLRYKRSTRERDRSSAQEIASRIVGEVTQGRVVSVARAPTIDLDVLVGQYLVDISAELAPETVATYQAYFVNNFAPRFHSLGSITSSAMQDYPRARLRQVKRGTVCKELSAMRGFLK